MRIKKFTEEKHAIFREQKVPFTVCLFTQCFLAWKCRGVALEKEISCL